MSFLDHEIDMTGRGEEVGCLFVDSFELVGHLEDGNCRCDAGADGGKRIWCGDDHVESMAGEGTVVLLETNG